MSLNDVGIIDYGLGNLRSVENALRAVGGSCHFVRTPKEVGSAERLLLPGVGSFNAGMRNLNANGVADTIRAAAAKGVPILGICLGMQLLVGRGDEGGDTEGLGLIPGDVRRFEPMPGLRIPHMGFNEVEQLAKSPLFEAIADRSDFYFVHSYRVILANAADSLAAATHGVRFIAAIRRDNVFGTQFHPEKSQSQGLQLLKNFCTIG